jgi:hypothetical protein
MRGFQRLSSSLEYKDSDAMVDAVPDWDIFQETPLFSLVPHLSGRDFRPVRDESRVHFPWFLRHMESKEFEELWQQRALLACGGCGGWRRAKDHLLQRGKSSERTELNRILVWFEFDSQVANFLQIIFIANSGEVWFNSWFVQTYNF